MEETPIRTVEMVRAIRDRIYEETKQLSREEFKAFIARGSEQTSSAKKTRSSGQSAA